MNVILSCTTDRKKGAIIISKNGKTEETNVFSVGDGSETKKMYTLDTVLKGIKSVRYHVNHEDLLLIEVDNSHLVEWLNRNEEYKGYQEKMGAVYELLDSLNCRYMFSYSKNKKVRDLLSREIDKDCASSLTDTFADFN